MLMREREKKYKREGEGGVELNLFLKQIHLVAFQHRQTLQLS